MYFANKVMCYSNALHNYAIENNNIDQVINAIENFLLVVESNPELLLFLSDPSIRLYDREKVAKQSLELSESLAIEMLIFILMRNQDILLLEKIIDYFFILHALKNDILICYMITAQKPTEEEKKQVEDLLLHFYNKEIYLYNTEMPYIIGGMILYINETALDFSYATRIDKIMNILEGNLENKDLLNELYN